jgi:hypothetical protein
MKMPAPLRAVVVAIASLTAAATAAQAGTASPLTMTFVNENTSYGSADNAWIMFSYTGSAATEFVGSVIGGPSAGPIPFSAGSGPSAGSYFSPVFPITDLAGGVSITATPSTRIYVSLGQALDAKADPTTPSSPFSSFGSPSTTAGVADPNWNIRWDFFETTLSDPRSAGDYGDISVINQLAIPLQVDLYNSATELTPANLLQSARTAPNPAELRWQLTELANANLANNNLAEFPGNWYVRTPAAPSATNPWPSRLLRQVGPASGGTAPQWIGPFPSMNPYAEFVGNGCVAPIETTLTDTTSVAGIVQQTYTMVTKASCSVANVVTGIEVSGTIETSTWDAGTSTWNTPTSDGKTYEMQIPLDTEVGGSTAATNYYLSNAIYGSSWQNNSGVTYSVTDAAITTPYTQAEFLALVSSNATMALQTVNQWMQNLFIGYNFGLIGNTGTVSNLPAGNLLIGVTLNDMGSAGWAELKTMIDVGTISTADVPFFTLTDAQQLPLYNQWAKIVFDNTQTAYGTQYSDMFQPLLALYSYQTNFVNNVYQETAQDVLAWKVTILPDLVPEPGAISSAAAGIALAALARRRGRRRLAG